ncbi:MAG: hypothetical protein KJ971_01845 [Firmicutes bacterium]|nr:hypothetical protein [Bacillota bacterium]
MKKKLNLLWITTIIVLMLGCTQTTTQMEAVENDQVFANLETFSLLELQEDYDDLVSKYELESPKLFTDIVEMESIIISQREKLVDSMNEIEFLRVLAPVVASINCAHSSINLSSTTYETIHDSGKFFALDVKIINDEIVVIDNSFETTVSVGSIIESINGILSSEIITRLKNSIPSDGQNETTKYSRINEDFRTSFYLYIDASDSHILEYKESDSDLIKIIKIDALTIQEIYQENRYGNWVPYEAEYGDAYAILDMNSFQPFDEYSITLYNSFIDNFFLTVESEGIQNIILDVRDNGGGDPMITSHLFNYLAKEEQAYFSQDVPNYYSGLKNIIPFLEPHFEGNLFVIMNGESGSSSGHLLALLKYQEVGVFIGEESGASYVVSDSTIGHALNNTKLNFRLSQQIWDVVVSGLTVGRGIMPDYEYNLSLSDYLSDEDDLLLYTISLIDDFTD